MGKIVAIGGVDIASPAGDVIADEINALVGSKKNKKVLYLPTGHRDKPDPDSDSRVRNAWQKRGYAVRFLFLTDFGLSDEYIENAFSEADLIYVSGGDLKFVMNIWKKRNVVGLLRKAYEKGTVLAGGSTGAMCWFHFGWDDCGIEKRHMFVEGTDILPYCFCPHFDSKKWHLFTNYAPMQEYDCIAADENTAIIFDNGRSKVIKGYPDTANCSVYIMRASEKYELKDLGVIEGNFIL